MVMIAQVNFQVFGIASSKNIKWGTNRIYFSGSIGPEYPWLKDNIEKSPAQKAETVTAAWTLIDWDPETRVKPSVVKIFQLEAVHKFDLSGLPFQGPELALITLVVFGDYQ